MAGSPGSIIKWAGRRIYEPSQKNPGTNSGSSLMPLPRLQLFELEDFDWFPAIVRDLATDYLNFIEAKFRLHRPVVPLLAEALRQSNSRHVVDLCSGAGGSIAKIAESLPAEGLDITFTLTDKFPNIHGFEQMAAQAPAWIKFLIESIDARSVPPNLVGFRTMFNAFHHFPPDDAVSVLHDAAKSGEPIAIFEIPDRKLGTLLPLFVLTPWMVLLATPFIRPFRWRRLLFTYVLPLVPFTSWWDGIVSQLRAYIPDELQALAKKVPIDGYSWKAGQVPIKTTPGNLTYLIGLPGVSASQ
jgi:hypothetical protein